MFSSTGRAIPQRVDSETTRQRILEVALDAFRTRGLEATTMRDLATAAGLSLGAAYYYFASKEAIVAAYYDYVQAEHLRLAREAFAAGGDLRSRLRAALHTKIDIVRNDQALLRGLFRYGGDPGHPLSWFGPATADQRRRSVQVFQEALAGERLPEDVLEAAPTLLWALHMGVLLYFLHDQSPQQRRTRALIDAAVDLAVDARRIVTLPLMRPLRRRVLRILSDAGLLAPAGQPA